MALFRHATLSNEEKVYVSEVDSFLLPEQALNAQLCKVDQRVLFDIGTAIGARNPAPKTSFNAGDMVCARVENNWARAEVLKVHDDKCLLDFVDYGYTAEYPKSTVFQLDPELCTKWERVAIHILLKNDMKITAPAVTALSCIEPLEIGGIRYYHGVLSSFSEITEQSKIYPIRMYVPPASTPTQKPTEPVSSETVVVNGHTDNPKPVNGHTDNPKPVIEQPELNEIERAFFSLKNEGSYCVQLSRFDVPALEIDLDTFHADTNNRKTATDVRAGGYFVAPYGHQFCRAFVLNVDEAGMAKILYTDYGEETSVAVKDLLELTPGRFTEHPWAMVTIETEDDISDQEEFSMRILNSYKDPYGLPIYRVKKCVAGSADQEDVAPISETKEPVKPCFPPLEFNEEEQEIYVVQLDHKYMAAQLGQYTVEEVESVTVKLTKSIEEEALRAKLESVAPGDLVAVKEDVNGVAVYYRGVVAKVEDQIVWVYQVDFGGIVQSDLEGVRRLPAEFTSFLQVGIRCELTETQQSEVLKEAFVVKNLRKKTHLDFIDIYEFDLTDANGETSVVEAQMSVPEVAQNQIEESVAEEPAPADSTDAKKVDPPIKGSEDADEKAMQAEDENHNYTHTPNLADVKSSHVPNGSHSVDAERESVSTDAVEKESSQKDEQGTPSEASEAAFSKTPAEKNSVEVITAAPKVGQTTPNGYEAGPEKFTYEFASRVDYPQFSSGYENVLVSQKTNTDMMVMLSRFGLDYLHAIDLDIKSFLEQHPNIEPTPLDVGDLVILIREDYYRRAEIVKKLRDEYCVTCIDYGSVFTVPKNQLIRLPKHFEKYPRCAVHVEGAFSFTMGQEVDLILSVDNGKVRAKTRPSVSPPSVANDRSYCESVRSSSVSVHSDNADDDDLTWARDPEDPCPDKSFDVAVTAVHRATKVCVVRNQSLSQARNVGEALKNLAQDLQPVDHDRLTMGSVVVAKLNTDPPRFRRAKIAHYNRATQMYKLFLVDSGLVVKLPLSSLFVLPAEFSLDRTPGYATILSLKADELAYDPKVVSEIFKGTLRCSLSYPHADESIPGELCYEATLRNTSGNVVKQLNMKGIVSTRTDAFPVNPVLLPCPAESEYLDAIVVSARKTEASSFDVTLLLVELKERLDRVVVDQNELKNLYVMKLGAPALAFLENDPTPWKRARVIGRPLPGQYKLLLVDVGIEITHPVLKTYKCPSNLLHIPEAAVEISIPSQRPLAPSDLQDRLVVVKATWKIDYTTKTPAVELYDHDGNSILP